VTTKLIPELLLALALIAVVSCTKESPSAKAAVDPPAPTSTKPSFVPPTAEEAYRLQDDCNRRGAIVMKNNIIGSALTQEQVSRYNPTTNRCYVRLEVRPMVLNSTNQFQNDTFLFDGQSGELLASFGVKGDGKHGAFLGFACTDLLCVSSKVRGCMNGKECDPDPE
jgi:hypothetical protein